MDIIQLIKEMLAKSKQVQKLLSDLTELWGNDIAFFENILSVKDTSVLIYPSILLLIAEKLQTLNDPNLYNQFDLIDIKKLYQINMDLNQLDVVSLKELALYMDAVLGETEEAVLKLEKAVEINSKLSIDLQGAINQVKDIGS